MPSSIAAIRLYRILQRHCRTQFPRASAAVTPSSNSIAGRPPQAGGERSSSSPFFLLQPPLDPRQAGSSRVTGIPVADRGALLKWMSHQLDDPDYETWVDLHVSSFRSYEHGRYNADADADDDDDDSNAFTTTSADWVVWTTAEAVQDAVRVAFRPRSPAEEIMGGRLDWAIRAYQVLLEQSTLLKSFSCREERGLRIAATSQFVGTSSNKFRFAYRIRIENVDAPEFQLLGRSWIIQEDPPTSETIRVHDPMGGAVGQFPVLQRGQAFEYMSGCELGSAAGTMKGCFHFRNSVDDALFEIPVQPFPLQSGATQPEQGTSQKVRASAVETNT